MVQKYESDQNLWLIFSDHVTIYLQIQIGALLGLLGDFSNSGLLFLPRARSLTASSSGSMSSLLVCRSSISGLNLGFSYSSCWAILRLTVIMASGSICDSLSSIGLGSGSITASSVSSTSSCLSLGSQLSLR